MHRIGWFAFALVAIGWLACEVDVAGTQPPRQPDAWRRTLDGWEKKTDWEPVFQPAIHPAVVGLFELLTGLTALAVFPLSIHPSSSRSQPRSHNGGKHANVLGPRASLDAVRLAAR